MTYNRDLQEDKERLFDSADTVRKSAKILAGMLRNTSVKKKPCAESSSDELLLATDLADYLVEKGVAFRDAHHLVGEVVALAEKQGNTLSKLKRADLVRIDKRFGADVKKVFNLKTAMSRRKTVGSPGTEQVAKQLKRWQKAMKSYRSEE